MKSVKEQWQKFRYKKTLLFGCFLVFVFFYDFTKVDHGFSVINKSDQTITLVSMVNDDREIIVLPEKQIPLEAGREIEIGCNNALSVSAYGGSGIMINIKRSNGFIRSASCELERPSGFFPRLFSNRYYEITYDGSKKLTCNSRHVSPGCKLEEYGLHTGYKLKN